MLAEPRPRIFTTEERRNQDEGFFPPRLALRSWMLTVRCANRSRNSSTTPAREAWQCLTEVDSRGGRIHAREVIPHVARGHRAQILLTKRLRVPHAGEPPSLLRFFVVKILGRGFASTRRVRVASTRSAAAFAEIAQRFFSSSIRERASLAMGD